LLPDAGLEHPPDQPRRLGDRRAPRGDRAPHPDRLRELDRLERRLRADMTTPLPAGWADQLLGSIGAPDTPTNVTLLEDWQTAEGGSTNNPDAFNPFNTTRNTDAAGNPLGGTPTNSVGVLSFPTWQAGEAATAATLEQDN